MKKQNIVYVIIVVLLFNLNIYAQDVNIVLKNSKVIVGRIIEELPDHILLDYELGQLRINRQNIQSISYNPFIKMGTVEEDKIDLTSEKSGDGYKFIINDPVVVYLRNGNVVAGILLAKSLNMVMLQTESGNLTIPKRDLLRIEYISSEYAERGEIVIVQLSSGTRFEGNIYFEDSENLTLDTEVGRLSIPKNKLRSIEYTGRVGVSRMTMVDQYAGLTLRARYIQPRYDVIEAGYNSTFGNNFGPGFGIGYQSRFHILQYEGLDISAIGSLSASYFVLNEDNLVTQNPQLSVNLKGGSVVTTIGAGGQLNIYPQSAGFYDFFVTPMVEGHLVYKTLEQNYPSFPQFNSKETTTEFKFGLAVKFGVEFLFDDFRLGIQYTMREIFDENNFSQVGLTFTKVLF